MVGKGQLGQLKEVRHRKHLMSCCIHSQFSISLGKESKAEGISAQKLDFSFRKASKDSEAKSASFLEPLSLLSPSPSCVHSIDTLPGTQVHLSVLKWSRNMEFLKICKYITIAKKTPNRTRSSILHLFIDFQELKHS